LKKLLVGLQPPSPTTPKPSIGSVVEGGEGSRPSVGIGMDASITPIPDKPGTCLAQTTDFFYPLVDDPYMQGRIACANVLSDLYAMGVRACHNMLMLLAVSKDMSEAERDVVIPLMMQGFQDTAIEAGCLVTGGQTVINPWVTIGGVASTVCSDAGDIILPEGATAGQVLLLTKPLGTQVAVNAHQWLEEPQGDMWTKVAKVTDEAEVRAAYRQAALSMARLNLVGAQLMHKYGATSATDVTGFGILGHAKNLAENQLDSVDFEIASLPVIKGMVKIARSVGNTFQLVQGYSAETSGGLLMSISPEGAMGLISEIQEREGCPAWIIGTVTAGSRKATIKDDFVIIEV